MSEMQQEREEYMSTISDLKNENREPEQISWKQLAIISYS